MREEDRGAIVDSRGGQGEDGGAMAWYEDVMAEG